MKRFKITLMAFAALSLLLVAACKKDENRTGSMTVMMTDAPGDFKEVNVEILAIEIHYNDGDTTNGWISLPTRAGIYNLLTLQDSVTALLATGTNLKEGKVTQMRLILGSSNTIVIDSVGTFPLTIPSGQNTGLKININQNIPIDMNLMITLDFDAHKSILKTGNEEYKLKPVITIKDVKIL